MTGHVLVTGMNGFVGRHLARALVKAGCEVSGVGQDDTPADELKALVNQGRWHQCDLSNTNAVSTMDLSSFDAIINLAGLANVRKSFDEPELYRRVNVAVVENLCKRLVEQNLNPRHIVVSSGAVYDNMQAMPLTEASSLAIKASPYALSKIAMEEAALGYKKRGLSELVIVRPFNHIGPGQLPGFIVPDIFAKLSESVKTGRSMTVGNLETSRDYTDVRDVAEAYTRLALAKTGELDHPIYNICSGTARSGNVVLAELKKHVPGSEQIIIEIDQTKLNNPNDPMRLVGSSELIAHTTSWSPQISFEQTIADFVTGQS